MRKCCLIIAVLCVTISGFSQSATKADELFSAQDFGGALTIYGKLLETAPTNQLYLYRYARCLQQTGQKESAIAYFEKAGEKYSLRNYHLGLLYMETYRFAEAHTCLSKYRNDISENEERLAHIDSCLSYCRLAERYLKRVERLAILDTIVLPKDDFLSFYDITADAGSLSYDNGNVTFLTSLKDLQCSVTRGDTSSLTTCYKILDNWTDCDTLPQEVNAGQHQNYPFMLADGVTLYFASDMEGGLGGYDIYVTRHRTDTDTWFDPENLGFPFNSSANDYMYAIDETKRVGWFATDRTAPAGMVAVYKFALNNEKQIITDAEQARLQAQLKSLSWQTEPTEDIDKTATEELAQQTEHTEADSTSTEIFISDDIIYSRADEFVSQEARKTYLQITELGGAIKEQLTTLAKARQTYAEEPAMRNILRKEIEDSESKLLSMYSMLKELTNRMRFLEINAK